MTERKTDAIHIRLAPSLKKAIEEAAKKERRSVNSFVEVVLSDYINQNK